MNTEALLLGPHEESRFLETLTLWGKIPNSGTLDDVIKEEAGGENTDLVKRRRETFYNNQGSGIGIRREGGERGRRGELGKHLHLVQQQLHFLLFFEFFISIIVHNFMCIIQRLVPYYLTFTTFFK